MYAKVSMTIEFVGGLCLVGLGIFEDESIHSYFLRDRMRQGKLKNVSSFNGLVTNSGVIRKLPSPIISGQNYDIEISLEIFELLLLKHSTYYGSRYYPIEELEDYVIYGIPLSKKAYPSNAHEIPNARTQLRYRSKCFEEQILHEGVSWFRLDWQCSIMCELHQKKLLPVSKGFTNCCNKFLNIRDNFFSAVTGICRNCGESEWDSVTELYVGDYNKSQYFLLQNDNNI